MELDIKKILAEIEKDVVIDELNIKEVQFKLPALKHKYVGLLVRSKITLAEKNKELEAVKKSVIDQLKEKSHVKLSPHTLSEAANDVGSIKKLKEEIEQLELLITLLEKTEKTLSSMTYDIKNIIEIQKLETT